MQKYKLINTKTKEEHLCDKVTIDGFDYYVSDETPKDKDKVLHKNGTIGVLTTALAISIVEGTNEGSYVDECKKVIACNNPNIDIPKITSKNEKQWGLLELWLRIEIALFLMSIPISLIILLFNFLEK